MPIKAGEKVHLSIAGQVSAIQFSAKSFGLRCLNHREWHFVSTTPKIRTSHSLLPTLRVAMSSEPFATEDYEPDPVFVNSLRETVVIISLFLLFLLWTVAVSFYLGAEQTFLSQDGKPLSLVWGMPNWVFYGIFLPWMIVNLIGIWFCFGFMKNDDLGEANDEPTSDAADGNRENA